ncbi:C6 transcription factor [Penicillium samsonianum]|uniref:C6 transcription factor n=1 Tax=Penicillium samsonianum TaxID=1882272 RepID=UPI002549104A|nr:C6 transcription factor [Penicillium samsonianum]KAJ6143578.1 C6 transcription factor [Penicillium samsonianum]
MSPPRKRRRPPKSCDPCRRRKVRCDREFPCGQCERARTSLQCFYGPGVAAPLVPEAHTPPSQAVEPLTQSRPSGPTSHSPPPDQDQDQNKIIQDLQRRLRRLEEQLPSPPTSQATTGPNAIISQTQVLRHLHDRVLGAEEQLSNAPRPGPSVNGWAIPATLPRLRVTPDKTKLFGPGHWLHTAEKFQVLGKFDAKEVEPSLENVGTRSEIAGIFKDCRHLRQAMKAQESVRLNHPVPDMLSTLPNQAVCDVLVDAYLRTFELIYRIIHIPSFREEYRQFWAQPHSISTHFLMKLVLILALGSTFYPDRSNRVHIRRLAHTWIFAAQWWLVGPSEKSTVNLDGLQVGCLLLLARQTNSLPGTSWLSAGSVLRMAISMGLHRTPDLFPALSVYQSEMRARLWATVLELTLLSSLDAAMPLPFSLQDIDYTAPSNLFDEQFDPETETLPTPQSSNHLTDSSIQLLLLKSLPVRVEAVRLLNNQHRQGLSYETVLRLANELRSACRDIAALFDTSRNQSRHAARNPGMTNFHLRFIDTYLHRYILFLHRPFMIQARKDPQFYLSRKVCLESCVVVASYADHLSLPSDTLDDLSHLTIVGRGSFKGALSFDVITSLGLEIITQLEEEASTRPFGSSPPFVADYLDEMAKAHRAPLVRSLEHIQEQLLQIIALGNPSLKRYNFLSAILSQIRAMESGQPIQPAIYETVEESLKRCYSLLQVSHAASSPQESVESLTTGPDSLPGFDVDALDPALGLEIPSLLFFPGLMDTSGIEW